MQQREGTIGMGGSGDGFGYPGNRVSGVEEIALERQRQINEEGWTPAHDAEHFTGQLAAAAAVYAVWDHPGISTEQRNTIRNALWPFEASWLKPHGRRANLVRAGALIAAEIDRLDAKS